MLKYLIGIFLLLSFFACSQAKYVKSYNKIKLEGKDTIKIGHWLETVNGKDIQIAWYKNGKKNGKVITFYNNGEMSIINYKNGEKNGVSKFYRTDRIIYKKEFYEKGTKKRTQTFMPKIM